MKIRTFILLISLALSACGGETSGADAALQKMHDAILARIPKTFPITTGNTLSRTKTEANVTTASTGKKAQITEPDLGVFSDARLNVVSDISSDMRNPRKPVMDGSVKLSGRMNLPAGTLSGIQGKGTEVALADLNLSGRVTGETFLFRIANLTYSIPGIPGGGDFPEAMAKQWYGMTFDELDQMLASQAEKTGATKRPPLRELLARSYGQRMTPEEARNLLKKIHVWNGIELLPEENGITRIRVESDKRKVMASVRAIVEHLKEASGDDWESRISANPDVKEKIESFLKDDKEFMESMGTVRGILSADSSSFVFRGFDGDIVDADGTLKAHVSIDVPGNGDVRVELRNTESGDAFVLVKTKETITATSLGKEVLNGTLSATAFAFTAKDPDTGKPVASLKGTIDAASSVSLALSGISGDLPSEHISIREGSVQVSSDQEKKTVSFRLKANVSLGSASELSVSVESERTPLGSLSVEKPEYKSIKELYQDLLPALSGAAR